MNQMPPMNDRLLPVFPDTADLLSVSRNTAYHLIRTGQLKAVHIGRRRLVPLSAIAEFIADRTR